MFAGVFGTSWYVSNLMNQAFYLDMTSDTEVYLGLIKDIDRGSYEQAIKRMEGSLYLSKLFFEKCEQDSCPFENVPEIETALANIEAYEFRHIPNDQ